MPVHPDTPPLLRKALEAMEGHVQSFKSSLPFTAPELVDMRYIELQRGLAEAMEDLYEQARLEQESVQG